MRRNRGFTLIELMIVVVVASILVTLAVAGYSQQIRKSRRTDAKTALLALAGREEQFFSTNNNYSTIPTDLGYTGGAFPVNVGSGYYQVQVNVPAPAAGTPATFSLVATPLGDQAKDLQCASFTVQSTGQQSSLDSGGADSTASCW